MNYTLEQLNKELKGAINHNELSLIPSLLPDGTVKDWVNTLPDTSLQMKAHFINDNLAHALTVSGPFDSTWDLPLLTKGAIKGGNVELTFTQEDQFSPIVSSVSFSGLELSIDALKYSVKGILNAKGELELTWTGTNAPIQLNALVADISRGTGSSFIDLGGLPLLKDVQLSKLSANIVFGDHAVTGFSLGISIPKEWKLIPKQLTVSNPSLKIETKLELYYDGSVSCTSSYGVYGQVKVKNTAFQVSLGLNGRDDSELSIQEDPQKGFPSLDDLATKIGGTAVSGILNQLPLSDLSIKGVSILLNASEKKVRGISILGQMKFFDGLVRINASLPDFSLYANLVSEEEGAIRLRPLFWKYFGDTISMPDTVISELVFNMSPEAGNYRFSFTVEDLVRIPIGKSELVLDAVEIDIEKSGGTNSGALSCSFHLGGVPFYASATYDGGDKSWLFTGRANQGSIQLKDFVDSILSFLDTHLPSNVPDISVSNLCVTFNTGTKEFSFTADTNTEIEVPFLTGDAAKIHAKVDLKSTVNTATGKRELDGFMEGDFTLGTSKFILQYALGKENHIFEASWESTDPTKPKNLLGINTFLKATGESNLPKIPTGVDLNLKKIYLQYQVERKTLKLVADSATYGEVFLIRSSLPLGKTKPGDTVNDPNTVTPQYVFGWNYANINKLSHVNGLGSKLGFADVFHMDSVSLLYTSGPIKHFEIPDMPDMKSLSTEKGAPKQVQATKRKQQLGQGSVVPLGKGFSLVAIMDLEESEKLGEGEKIKALQTVVPETKLTTTIAVNTRAKTFTLSALLDGRVSIATGKKSTLQLANPMLSFIYKNGFNFQLSGELGMQFGDQRIEVTPKLSISAEEAEFLVNVDFENGGWKKPLGIEGLTIDEAGFAMGVNFEPPGVNFGLEGQFHIGDKPQSPDKFAFVLEVVEEIPDPLLLNFYLKEIDVKTAMQVFVPETKASDLPDFVNQIKLTEVNFYWAELPVVVPDGSIAEPGLRFSGNLKILDFKAHAALKIDQNTGISGEFEMSPIHFQHILSITGKGKGVYRKEIEKKDGTGKKPLPLSVKPDKNVAALSKVEIVPPGGPYFQFQSTHSPFLRMSLQVSFLDLLHEEVESLVTNDSIQFQLHYDLGGVVNTDLAFALSKTGFAVHAAFGIHLKADIGPIEILGVDFGHLHIDT